MDNETALKTVGICVLGDIDPKLIELLRIYVESAVLKHRHHRQTELEWNSICDDVLNYFETHLKPLIEALRNRTWISRRLVKFHNISESSEIYRPDKGKGMYTVIIPIHRGPGFPRVCERSHIPNNASVPTSPVDIPQAEGSVVVFDAGLACQNPAVKDEDIGGSGMLLLY